MLLLLDRYLAVISAGLCAGVWLIADVTGHELSKGTEASMGLFTTYAWLKSKSDNRWRKIELERDEMQALVERLEKTKPGSPEALEVRRDLVALARRVDHDDHGGDGDG